MEREPKKGIPARPAKVNAAEDIIERAVRIPMRSDDRSRDRLNTCSLFVSEISSAERRGRREYAERQPLGPGRSRTERSFHFCSPRGTRRGVDHGRKRKRAKRGDNINDASTCAAITSIERECNVNHIRYVCVWYIHTMSRSVQALSKP